MLDTTKKAATAMTARMSTRHSRWNIWSLYRCLRCCRCRMVPGDELSAASLTGVTGRVRARARHPPFRETMIHIKNAVRVRDRGKMRIMTMNNEALCNESVRRRTFSRAYQGQLRCCITRGTPNSRPAQPRRFRPSTALNHQQPATRTTSFKVVELDLDLDSPPKMK